MNDSSVSGAIRLNHEQRRRLKFGNTRTFDVTALREMVASMGPDVQILPVGEPAKAQRRLLSLRRVNQQLRRRNLPVASA